jgi:hypothetical protein
MTVGDLIKRLQQFDPADKVIFRSPEFGCYGPDTDYTIDDLSHEALEGREIHHPGGLGEDEETGEEYAIEAYTEVFKPWSGVVIR